MSNHIIENTLRKNGDKPLKVWCSPKVTKIGVIQTKSGRPKVKETGKGHSLPS